MALGGERACPARSAAHAPGEARVCARAGRSCEGGCVMATVEQVVHVEQGSSEDIDAVMSVMNSAFGRRYGEAWTRSQLAGILPMGGVSLVLAREGSADTIGFCLFRTVADESELLLLAVSSSCRRRGIGRRLLD